MQQTQRLGCREREQAWTSHIRRYDCARGTLAPARPWAGGRCLQLFGSLQSLTGATLHSRQRAAPLDNAWRKGRCRGGPKVWTATRNACRHRPKSLTAPRLRFGISGCVPAELYSRLRHSLVCSSPTVISHRHRHRQSVACEAVQDTVDECPSFLRLLLLSIPLFAFRHDYGAPFRRHRLLDDSGHGVDGVGQELFHQSTAARRSLRRSKHNIRCASRPLSIHGPSSSH